MAPICLARRMATRCASCCWRSCKSLSKGLSNTKLADNHGIAYCVHAPDAEYAILRYLLAAQHRQRLRGAAIPRKRRRACQPALAQLAAKGGVGRQPRQAMRQRRDVRRVGE